MHQDKQTALAIVSTPKAVESIVALATKLVWMARFVLPVNAKYLAPKVKPTATGTASISKAIGLIVVLVAKSAQQERYA